MRKRKCFLVFFLTMALMLTVLPVPVSANSPAPSPWYTFFVSDFPKGTVYVDILIQLPKTDPKYQELVSENIPDGFSLDAEIIHYCEDDFRSYTFHYRGARSIIKLDHNNSITLFANSTVIYDEESEAYDHLEDIEQRGMIRIAMLDAQGNILQISKPQSIRPTGLFSYSLGTFHYNAAQDELIVDSHSNVMGFIVLAFISVIGIIWNGFVEWLIALMFDKIKDYSRLIVLTNVVSQILMRTGQVVLLWVLGTSGIGLSYFWLVIILEILVYLCEYLFYCRKMPDISRQRCLAYTICANTASALSGLLLLMIMF